MERRDFLKLAFEAAAGTLAVAAAAQAAPLSPLPIEDAQLRPNAKAQPAVTSSEEAAQLQPEQVRWGWQPRRWRWHPRRHFHRRDWHGDGRKEWRSGR